VKNYDSRELFLQDAIISLRFGPVIQYPN